MTAAAQRKKAEKPPRMINATRDDPDATDASLMRGTRTGRLAPSSVRTSTTDTAPVSGLHRAAAKGGIHAPKIMGVPVVGGVRAKKGWRVP